MVENFIIKQNRDSSSHLFICLVINFDFRFFSKSQLYQATASFNLL